MNKKKTSHTSLQNWLNLKKIKREELPESEENGVTKFNDFNQLPSPSPSTSSSLSSNDLNSNVIDVRFDISQNHDYPPVQPILATFPKTKDRKFNPILYKTFKWIEYSVLQDSLYCYACRHFSKNAVWSGQQYGKVPFVDYGIKKWKDIKALLEQHAKSQKHIISVKMWLNYKAVQTGKQHSIANQLDIQRNLEIKENRDDIRLLLKATIYLGRQGLAFRGKDELSQSSNKGNFLELLDTFCDDNEKLKEKLNTRYGHYTSPEYQNDLIAANAYCTRKYILSRMTPMRVYSFMVDESKDSSKKEQLSFAIRFVDIEGNIQEKALGCYHMKSSDAASLSEEIKKCIVVNNLDITKCVAQCYDGASVMSGAFSGVQKRIREAAPTAIYLHCHAHRLNLCLINTIKNISVISNFFDIVQNLYTFIMNGQTRYELFIESQKVNNVPIIHLERLVDTRWFYWYTAVKKINLRFSEILDTLITLSHQLVDANSRSEATGLLNEIVKQNFLLTLHVMESILEKINVLSKELQSKTLNVPTAMTLIIATKNSLIQMRTEESWKNLVETVNSLMIKNKITESTAHQVRTRCTNKRLTDYFVTSTIGKGCVSSENQMKIEMFYSVIDRFLAEMDRRFLDNSSILQSFSAFIPDSKHFLNYDIIKDFATHYQSIGIDLLALSSELSVAETMLEITPGITILEIRDQLMKTPTGFGEIIKLINIILTLPISTATNERFFSSMKRIKSCIRQSSGDERLSNLLILNVESDDVKKIDLEEVVDHFAKMKKRRYPLIN